MGKATAVHSDLRVELAQETLQAGDTLHGTIYLHLAQAVEAGTLKLHILGRQGLNWLMAAGHGMVAHGNKVDHLVEEITLAENVTLDEGDAVYPFSFHLPDDLQHNFVYFSRRIAELQGVRVSVQYEVVAEWKVAGRRGVESRANASFRIDPLPMAVPFGRRVDATSEETIKFMGMMNRGACRVVLSIDTDVLDASSTIEARVTLDLKTPLAIKYITIVLYEKAAVDRHNQLFPGKTLGSRQVCCRRLDKAAIPTQDGGPIQLTMQLPLTPNEISEFEPVLPTMTSFFVDVHYRVALEVKFPMAPRITVGVPVTLIQKLVAPHELEVATVA